MKKLTSIFGGRKFKMAYIFVGIFLCCMPFYDLDKLKEISYLLIMMFSVAAGVNAASTVTGIIRDNKQNPTNEI